MEKEGLRSTDVDLSISNAQTSESFKNEQEMISKNSSVVVARTPLSRRPGNATSSAYTVNMPKKTTSKHTIEQLKQMSNLATVNADEEDKIEGRVRKKNSRKILIFQNSRQFPRAFSTFWNFQGFSKLLEDFYVFSFISG